MKVQRKKKESAEKRIAELDNIIRCLYEDRSAGRTTVDRYDTLASGYEQEQAALKGKLTEMTAVLDEQQKREQLIRQFMENAKRYIEIRELTPEILRAFIQRIEVHEKTQ
ncbi:MAG: DUF4368 domain-containing protein [Clostridiales bacterium]|nr:DUF4368 domain-containing protein [Clostridiales bacterium]